MLRSSFDPPLQKSDRLVSRCARWNFQTLPKWWTGWKPWLLAFNLLTMCEWCTWQWAGFYAVQTIKTNTATNQNASSNETANERLSNSGQPIKTTMTSKYPGIHMTSSSENNWNLSNRLNKPWPPQDKNSTWPYLYEIPAHFIGEINTINYDVSDVNIFPPTLMRFPPKKEVNSVPPILLSCDTGQSWQADV